MDVMLKMQRPDGHVEDWYGEGNFNRTALLYAYQKSQGVRPERWEPGVGVGAVAEGTRLLLHLDMPAPRRIQFDFARHRRVMNFAKNYVRLNEFPEWFTVDENHLYVLRSAAPQAAEQIRLGSELDRWRRDGSGRLDRGTKRRATVCAEEIELRNWGTGELGKRLRPERGAKPPSESAWEVEAGSALS